MEKNSVDNKSGDKLDSKIIAEITKAVEAKFKKKMDEQDEQITLLTKVASKNKLAKHTNRENLGTNVRISLYRESLEDTPKIVTSWRTLKNDVLHTVKGIEINQTVELTLEDDSKIVMNLTDQPSLTEKAMVVLDDSTTYNKDKSLKMCSFVYNGVQYKIDPKFIN